MDGEWRMADLGRERDIAWEKGAGAEDRDQQELGNRLWQKQLHSCFCVSVSGGKYPSVSSFVLLWICSVNANNRQLIVGCLSLITTTRGLLSYLTCVCWSHENILACDLCQKLWLQWKSFSKNAMDERSYFVGVYTSALDELQKIMCWWGGWTEWPESLWEDRWYTPGTI